MNLTRVIGIGLVGGVVVTWLAGAATPVRSRASVAAPRVRTTDDGSAAALAEEIARLRERLHPDAAPVSGRNIFTFSGAKSPAPSSAALDRTVPGAPVSPEESRAPDLTLSGMAQDPGPDGPIRTAVISTPAQLYLAKVGDVVAERYRVVHLSSDSAELTDLSAGETVRLTLR